MPAPTYDQTAPAAANAWDDDLDQIRDNMAWLAALGAAGAIVVPNWTTTVNGADPAQPDSIELTRGSVKIRFTYTWSTGKVTQIVVAYDRGLGAGYETMTGGTITLTYDGSDNFTGATTV